MTTVELVGVSRWYGNLVALNDVTMTLGPGVTGLLGPNGAGKTTLLHMMAGFLAPSRGTVTVDGRPAWRNPSVYRDLGLVSERESVHRFLTGWEFVLASAKLHRLPDPAAAAKRALELVEMTPHQSRRIDTYSKGMRQRIRVAAALVHDPGLLLLDEPFNGMDPRQRLHMMELLHQLGDEGRTILFSSHILEEVEQLSGTVAGDRGGSAGRLRRLPFDPPADDPPAARVHGVLHRRPAAGGRADARTVGHRHRRGIPGLTVRAGDYGKFTRALPKIALREGIRVQRLLPSDESLESVFSYLVAS